VPQASELIHALRPERGMLGRDDIHGGFIEQFMVGNSQLLAGNAVAIDDLSFEIHDKDGVAGTLKKRFIAIGGRHQRFDGADIKG